MGTHNISLKDYVSLDGTEISSDVNGVHTSLSKEQVNASGFNATGVKTTLVGEETQQVTLDILYSPGTHALLYGIYKNNLTVDFVHRVDVNSSASATNPELRGTVNIFDFPPEAVRGSVRSFSVTLLSADATGLVYYET